VIFHAMDLHKTELFILPKRQQNSKLFCSFYYQYWFAITNKFNQILSMHNFFLGRKIYEFFIFPIFKGIIFIIFERYRSEVIHFSLQSYVIRKYTLDKVKILNNALLFNIHLIFFKRDMLEIFSNFLHVFGYLYFFLLSYCQPL